MPSSCFFSVLVLPMVESGDAASFVFFLSWSGDVALLKRYFADSTGFCSLAMRWRVSSTRVK